MDRVAFLEAARTLGLHLSEEQLDRFEQFEEKLYEANKVMNLTRVPREECWSRHFVDSLLIQDLIPKGAAVLDLGTGPGFPAWPLACARPDLKVTALDSSGKMIGFLKENPLANLKTLLARAEEFPQRNKFDVVTGRAVAPLAIQLEVSAGPCRVGGAVMPMRTPGDEDQARALRLHGLGIQLERIEKRTLGDAVRLFPIYRKMSETEGIYPRTWAEIKRKPLT